MLGSIWVSHMNLQFGFEVVKSDRAGPDSFTTDVRRRKVPLCAIARFGMMSRFK